MVKSLSELIPAQTLSTVDTDHAVVMLWALDGSRILAASRPALRLFNVFDEAELIGRRFGPALQSTTKIAELGKFMGLQDPPRVERLRLFIGVQSETITCLCQRIVLNNNAEALLLTSREQKRSAPRWSGAVDRIGGKTNATAQAKSANMPAPPLDSGATFGSPVRFVFETGADLKITSISEQLKQSFDLKDAHFIGRSFAEIGDDLGLIGVDQLNQKLATRQTWQGVTLLWPMNNNMQQVSVELSGLPVLTQAREFRGFRGFGLIRFDRVSDVEKPHVIEPVVQQAAEKTVDPGDARKDAIHTAMTAFKAERAERLSQSERNAFKEIAKVLGAPHSTEDERPSDAPYVQPDMSAWENDIKRENNNALDNTSELNNTRENVSASASHIADLDKLPVLDRLPIGVLIFQSEKPVFLNKTLLDLLDYVSVEEFIAENALENLFDGGEKPAINDTAISNVKIRARSDEILSVAAHLQTIQFESKPATLISFRRAVEAVQDIPAQHLPAQHLPAQSPSKLTLVLPSDQNQSETLGLAQQLREAERERDEMRAVLDTATDGVISLDSEGRIIGLSRSAEALFGVSQNEVAGERLSTLLTGDSHAAAMDYFDGVKSGGVASLLNDGREVTGREKKGGRIPLFMTLGRISEHSNGKFCVVLRDLTAWKKAEAELTESRRIAERASAMKSDFLAKISHEIRTPMNAIIGFAEVMQTEQLGPIGHERYKEYLGDIHRSGEHVVSLVNDLLDLSKIEAGQADLSFTSVDLNLVLQDCVSMMQPQASREKVIIRMNVNDKLPAVVADARSVKQILLNLLSNATKFNQPGGQIVVSTALNDEGEAVIRVRDTGIGMNDKELEAAMQPFRQVSVTRRGGGTGLGLPLTKALVEANRANLTLKSTPNEGTLAEVVFPATRVLAE